jgi:hypothetical protein
MMPDVPYFCYSHLIAKITVGPALNTATVAFDATMAPKNTLMEKVLSQADYTAARARIAAVRATVAAPLHRVVHTARMSACGVQHDA